MYERLKAQYDSLYTSGNDIFGDGPVEVVTRLTDHLAEGSVLDLGGGEGRNAVYLAARGFLVTVYDFSEVAIDRLTAFTKENDLPIESQVFDITREEIAGTFNAVILTSVLHHLEAVDARKVIFEAQEHTAQNGVHVVVTFANDGELYDRNKGSTRFYPSEATLRELYGDWDIKELSLNDTTTFARNKKGDRMQNQMIALIAMRRGF